MALMQMHVGYLDLCELLWDGTDVLRVQRQATEVMRRLEGIFDVLLKKASLLMTEKGLLWRFYSTWETIDRILGSVAKEEGLAQIAQSS